MIRSGHATTRMALALGAIALLLIGAGCSASSEAPKTSADTPLSRGAEAAPRIIFDMAHGEIFGAEDTSDLGQSKAVELIRESGFNVEVNTAPLTAESLDGAAGVVLAGPMRALMESEQRAIQEYVRTGGTVLMTVHVPFPVLSVPQAYGLKPTTFVLESTTPLPGAGDPSVLIADGVVPDPITTGVSRIFVLSGWGVDVVGVGARTVVETAEDTWIDVDRDNALTSKDRVGPFGLVGVSDVGAGSFILVGDDAVFANVGIDQADNAQLLRNVLKLMAERTKAI